MLLKGAPVSSSATNLDKLVIDPGNQGTLDAEKPSAVLATIPATAAGRLSLT